MFKTPFSIFLLGFLFGCTSEQEVEPQKIQPKVVEVKKTPVTREEMRAEAKDAAKQIVISTADKTKTVDLFSAGLSTKDNKKVDLTKTRKDYWAYYANRRKVSDFYATNLGIPSVKNGVYLPDQMEVSFDANMATFWNIKVSKENVTDLTLGNAPEILERYMSGDRGYTTLDAFVPHTHNVISHARNSLDWGKLCAKYKLDNDKQKKDLKKKVTKEKEISKCQVLKEIIFDLKGKDFIAFGMTELFPNEPNLNVLYLDMLLQNAGTSYIMHIPAMHDKMLSLGLYQFTSHALRKDDEETEGASIVNGFVKEGGMKIPDSVAYLVGDGHHVAALYFAINNFAKLIKKLDKKGLKTLHSKHKNYKEEMVMFVAAAHHLPTVAYRHTQKWIQMGMKSSLLGAYRESVGNYDYAIKTQGNLIALSKKYP